MIEVKPKGKIAIIYTDGGARPSNPGPAGTGVHGYVFSEVATKPEIIANHFRKPSDKDPANFVAKATITNQGYMECDKEGKTASRYDHIKPAFYLDIAVSYPEWKTNNFAELAGFLYAFQAAKEIEGLQELIIRPDSQYALDCISAYGDGWRNNGWKTKNGDPVKNPEIIEEILKLRDEIRRSGIKIDYSKVKGHSDDVGNSYADYLSNVGAYRSMNGEYMVDVRWSIGNKKYWEMDVDRHPMLHGRRFIYNRVVSLNDPKEIFQVEPGGIDLTIGKRDHEGYSIVRLKEPCKSFESVLKAQARYNQGENWPMVLKTDVLFGKFTQKFLEPYGHNALVPNQRGQGLYFLDGDGVAVEHNPPALVYRTVEAFGILGERLEEYLDCYEKNIDKLFNGLEFAEGYHDLSAIDITDDFFDTVEKKSGKGFVHSKVLKPMIEVGYQKHFVDLVLTVDGKVSNQKVPLTLGMDLPPRNALKKLETEDPRITLITWREAPGSFQYACVVECVSGVGIWSNYYCDRFFV